LARVLRVEFDGPESFQSQYADHLVKGGVFVPTSKPFELRERVTVVLALTFCDEKLALGGEVVYRVTPEMAPVGGTAGVAVQFDGSPHAVRKMLEPLRRAAGTPELRAEDPGRRRSPRVEARVAARIDGGDGRAIAGHTRDVSQTGVLVAVPGKGVPVGERVRIALTHPTTGESMEIEGVVARAVETEGGGVAAVGIEFAPGDQEREAVAGFVESVQHTEQARRMGGIRGDLAELGAQHVLQMFAASAREGTLTLQNAGEEALVGFEKGLLRYVRLGTASGLKALVRLLTWSAGSFEFHARLDPLCPTEVPLPFEAALLEALQQRDELALVNRHDLSPARRLRSAGEPPSSPSKIEAAVLELAGAGFNLGRMLDIIPEPDPEILGAVAHLVDCGALALE
jgi:Tfp pilus assembly protein PilZ